MVFVSYKLVGGRGVIFWFSDKLREMECWVVGLWLDSFCMNMFYYFLLFFLSLVYTIQQLD